MPPSQLLPNDGLPPGGGDHDSVGLFQQRASWGPLTARMDPAAASRLFVTRLLGIPAWQSVPPGVAAQLVQVSKFPDRYATTQPSTQAWLRQIAGSAAEITCGGDGLTQSAAGTIKPGSIPAGYSIPAVATDAERRAVTFALAQLGKPYVFGATGPAAYDCSGLTLAAWAAAGIDLPHYTVAQYQAGVPVASLLLLAPGDLIFIPGDEGSLNPPNPQHVGMYLGDGSVIEAPQTGDVVKIVPLSAFSPVIGSGTSPDSLVWRSVWGAPAQRRSAPREIADSARAVTGRFGKDSRDYVRLRRQERAAPKEVEPVPGKR